MIMIFIDNYFEILNIVRSEINKTNSEILSAINLSPEFDPALKTFLSTNPKRIRPLISYLYTRACGKNIDDRQLSFQSAIEIIHNASLIHDDVVDESDSRRGNLSLNKQFNNKLAILCGDYLLSIALEKLNNLNQPEIIDMCADTLKNMCIGEVNQYYSKFKITSIENYLEKTAQKTAKLFQTAVLGSVILAGIEDRKSAYDFSLNFGIAFQIRDDLLNITAKNDLKPLQSDIQNGIYNAPVILGGGISNLHDGIEKTKVLLNNYIDKAQNALSNLEENKYKQALVKLLELFRYE